MERLDFVCKSSRLDVKKSYLLFCFVFKVVGKNCKGTCLLLLSSKLASGFRANATSKFSNKTFLKYYKRRWNYPSAYIDLLHHTEIWAWDGTMTLRLDQQLAPMYTEVSEGMSSVSPCAHDTCPAWTRGTGSWLLCECKVCEYNRIATLEQKK